MFNAIFTVLPDSILAGTKPNSAVVGQTFYLAIQNLFTKYNKQNWMGSVTCVCYSDHDIAHPLQIIIINKLIKIVYVVQII